MTDAKKITGWAHDIRVSQDMEMVPFYSRKAIMKPASPQTATVQVEIIGEIPSWLVGSVRILIEEADSGTSDVLLKEWANAKIKLATQEELIEDLQAYVKKLKAMLPEGKEEGDICNRDGCTGLMGYEPVEGCVCHLGNPPCSSCEDNPLVCLECGAEVEE